MCGRYVLVQQDWQHVIYVREEIGAALGMAGGVDVQAAYHRGYTTQPNRTALIPWGKSLEHLLHYNSHAERMAAALKWLKFSSHKQNEGVVVGCGGRYAQMRFAAAPAGRFPVRSLALSFVFDPRPAQAQGVVRAWLGLVRSRRRWDPKNLLGLMPRS